MEGRDDKLHTLTTQAISVFDAANQAIQAWVRLWWFHSETDILVQWNDERWLVRQDAVRR